MEGKNPGSFSSSSMKKLWALRKAGKAPWPKFPKRYSKTRIANKKLREEALASQHVKVKYCPNCGTNLEAMFNGR